MITGFEGATLAELESLAYRQSNMLALAMFEKFSKLLEETELEWFERGIEYQRENAARGANPAALSGGEKSDEQQPTS